MPTRDAPAPQGLPCWLDLGTPDRAKSIAFYDGLFGWTDEDAGEDFGHYVNFSKDGVQLAGCMETPEMNGWSTYLATDDINKVVEASAAHGGGVALPPMAVGELGHMAYLIDPTQAVVGAWQSGEHTGFGVFAEPGAPAWFELFTRDFEGSIAYYRDVFGADIEILQDSPDFRYAVFVDGEVQVAGIMDASAFLPEGAPGGWSVYFHTADTGASVARAVELGATLVQGPDETPYGILTTLTDPNGATFKLQEPPKG